MDHKSKNGFLLNTKIVAQMVLVSVRYEVDVMLLLRVRYPLLCIYIAYYEENDNAF